MALQVGCSIIWSWPGQCGVLFFKRNSKRKWKDGLCIALIPQLRVRTIINWAEAPNTKPSIISEGYYCCFHLQWKWIRTIFFSWWGWFAVIWVLEQVGSDKTHWHMWTVWPGQLLFEFYKLLQRDGTNLKASWWDLSPIHLCRVPNSGTMQWDFVSTPPHASMRFGVSPISCWNNLGASQHAWV